VTRVFDNYLKYDDNWFFSLDGKEIINLSIEEKTSIS